MKTIVIIPYIASQAQGGELPLCIAGWLRHCRADVQLVVVGDSHECLEEYPEVHFIELPRETEQTEGNCVKHLEFVRVIRRVLEEYPKARHFVLTSDDTFAVADFGMEELAYPKCLGLMRELPETGNTWIHDKNKTLAMLREAGIPAPYDFSTHLPYLMDRRKWERIVGLFGMDSNSLVIEDMYYNLYFQKRVPVRLSDGDSIRGGVWRSTPNVETIRGFFGTKTWINCNEAGFVPALREMLEAHYHGKDGEE